MPADQAISPIDVTVTFLQMDAPPSHYPPQPANRSLALFLTRSMPRHFYRYLMDRVGRKWHWVNVLRLNNDSLDARLGDPARDISVLYVEGSPAGFFELTMLAGNTCELTFFGLMPHVSGQGLGRWFLGAAIDAAWRKQPARVVVQTCTLDHPAALPLYQKLGFRPVAQEPGTVTPLSLDERARILID